MHGGGSNASIVRNKRFGSEHDRLWESGSCESLLQRMAACGYTMRDDKSCRMITSRTNFTCSLTLLNLVTGWLRSGDRCKRRYVARACQSSAMLRMHIASLAALRSAPRDDGAPPPAARTAFFGELYQREARGKKSCVMYQTGSGAEAVKELSAAKQVAPLHTEAEVSCFWCRVSGETAGGPD